jgi:hypothetical protein
VLEVASSILVPLPSQSGSLSPTLSVFEANLQGCRESEVDDEALLVVFDSLLPVARGRILPSHFLFFLEKKLSRKLRVGNLLPHRTLNTVGKGKEYAWSRGLGIEISPLKLEARGKN